MDQLRLFGMTAVLTLLIWASADSLVTETASVGILLKAVPVVAGSNMVLHADPNGERCDVQISGPRRTVQAVQVRGPYHVRLPIEDRPTGEARIPLDRHTLKRELTEQWSDFGNLTVVSVNPDMLSVVVDRVVTMDVEVAAKRLTLSYDVEPQLQRTTATVEVRESFLQTLPAGQPLQIDIGPDIERLLKDQPVGKSVTVRVSLDSRRFGPEAEVKPNAIEVTATVRAQRSTEQIPTVPVLVAMSFANLEKRVRAVTRDGSPLTLVTQTISVTGPTDEVMRLVRGETRAHGIIQLKEDDLQQMGVLKLAVPEYHLPKGLDLAAEPPPIEFQLIIVTDTAKTP